MPKETKSKKAANGTTLGFEQKLWQAADALRNNMDAAEYKHVVLGLIFLKYISDAFEAKHAELVAEKSKGADPEDPDEYRAASIFWVPKKARWSHLKTNAPQPTIGKLGDISIYGQESNYTTWRLAKMNLAIRGIDAQIAHGDTFHNDKHPDLKADYVLANPPFNDSDWRGELLKNDKRWVYGAPPAGNANFAWVQHFIHHLAPTGLAGFVLANGSMSSNQSNEGEIRKNIIEADLVDCMVALPGQLFYSTQILVCLWFLARNKAGQPPSPAASRHPLPMGEGRGEGSVAGEAYDRLFPDSFEDSELGEIPKGWDLMPLPDAIDVNPTRALQKGEIAPYLDMANMPTRGHSPDAVIDRPFGSGMRFVNGDTLVARITPCLENGKTAYVDFLGDGQVGWGSTEYIVLRPKPPLPDQFAYCLARGAEFRDFAIQSMTGSSGRQRVPAESLSHFRVVATPQPVAELFGRFVKPLFARASEATEEGRTLAALRDTLLRKLISGELRVEKTERFVAV